MVSKELSDAYDNCKNNRELYKKVTRRGNFFNNLGKIIFFLSIFFIIPLILQQSFGIDPGLSMLGGILLGLLLMIIGNKINNRTQKPKFSFNEEEFIRVYESLKDVEAYQKIKFDDLRFEAAKKLSKIEQRINEPPLEPYPLWEALTKDVIESLRSFKRNFKEKLLPNITLGNEEDLKKAYFILEKFAQYLLNPTISELKDLNNYISELTSISYPSEKPPLVSLFGLYWRDFKNHILFLISVIIFILAAFNIEKITQYISELNTDTVIKIGMLIIAIPSGLFYVLKIIGKIK